MPMDVKTSIDHIIERAVAPGEKFELKLIGPSLTMLKSGNLKIEKKIDNIGQNSEGNNVTDSVKKAEKKIFDQGNENIRNYDLARRESMNKISDANETPSNKKDANSEKDPKDIKAKNTDIIHDGASSIKFETLSSVLKIRSADNLPPANTIEMLGKQISNSVARGDKVISLQLTPPELGTIKLSIEIKDNSLRIGMLTETSTAKEILLTNSNDLKHVLANYGIKLDRLDVLVNPNSGHSLTDSNYGFGQEYKQHKETGSSLLSDADAKEDISPDFTKRAVKNYLVDLTA